MSNKIKNIIMCIGFIAVIFGFFIANLLIPDSELSYSERRKLNQFPAISKETILNGDFFKKFNKYTLDQFPLREQFRTIKSISHFFIFNQKDNNDIFIIDGNASKLLYPLNERSVIGAAEKLNSIYNEYLQGLNVYYSIVPDKNYYIAIQNGYPSIDYEKCAEILNNNIDTMKYINLFDCLSVNDFYRTDPHWKQESLGKVIERLSEKMQFQTAPLDSYNRKQLYPFFGAYYGQSALPLKPDTLTYLINNTIEAATVYNLATKEYIDVYDTEKFGKMDSYDLYLGGALPLVEITNTKASTDKELIIFRDSSGSSIAPLLLEGYKKITLVDLRYISTRLMGEYIDFTNQDVLFLYNVAVLNNSMMLK